MAIENLNSLKGTIYSKETKTWPNKKAGEPDHQFYYFKLEFEVKIEGRTINSIAEFTLKMGLGMEEFSAGDNVEIDYYPLGKELKKKDGSGTWWKRENVVVYIKFSDITSPPKPKNDNGKVRVPSMSDINTIADPPKKEEDVFAPNRPSEVDNESYDDLPF
jgi:hypothetical protein